MITRWLSALGFVFISFSIPAHAGDVSARKIDVSNQSVFPMRWHQTLVRKGTHREMSFAMGKPVVSNKHNLVIVGTGEGNLFGLSTRSGDVIWSKEFPTEFEAFGSIAELANGDEIALLSSRDGVFYAVSTELGKVVWSVNLGAESRAEPIVVPEGILVATAQSELVLLGLNDGKRIWNKRRTQPSSMTVLGHSRPLVNEQTVYMGFADGYVAAYNLETGKELWAMPAGLGQGRFLDVDTDPVMVDGKLVIASYASGVVALEPASGKPLWQQKASGINRLTSDGKRLFAASGDGLVWRLNPANGNVLYRVRIESGPVSRMTLRGNLLVFAGGPNGLVVLDATDGKPLQATAIRGGANSEPSWSDLGIFVLGNRGDLYAFDIR